jgi:hypothetical protein
MAGQIWATNSLGGYMYSDNLSEELRMAVQPMTKFRQFCDAKDATFQGKKHGDTYHWDVYQDVSNAAASTLTETNTMPETNFTIVQGTLTIQEAGNSVPYSGKLDDLSYHPVKTIVNSVLKNDATKWFDAAAATQFNATPLRVVGTSSTTITLTTNGTAVATNSQAFNTGHAKLIVDTMKERNIPAYTADDYYALAWPTTFRFVKNQLESIHQYTDKGFGMIMNGEIGRYENTRYIEQTNIPKGGATDSTTWNAFSRTADAWNGGFSDWIYFFGADTVAEAIAVPEEMRGKIPTDFGRSRGVAWYYLGGFGIVHPVADAANARICKWDSAV